jgi:uncharacterized repeat protein (TIGR03833 family)
MYMGDKKNNNTYKLNSVIKLYPLKVSYNIMQNNQTRSQIKPGVTVLIVLKQDQRTGKLTKGIVKDILTKSPNHPHGIKVRLMDGLVGRVKQIVSEDSADE